MGEPVKQKTYYQIEATGEVGIVQKGETLPDGAKALKKAEYEELVAQQEQGGGDNGGASGDDAGGDNSGEGGDQNGTTGSDDQDQGGGEPNPQEPAAASDEATGEVNRDGFAPGQEVSFEDIQAMRVKQRQVWERAKREQREKALEREAERLAKK